MSNIFHFVLFLAGFTLVIFIHELGHFLAAKWVGIKVEQFAIGFGSAAVSWRKGLGIRFRGTQAEYEAKLKAGTPEHELGETEYRINWLPLGGYVKMLGQDDMDPLATSSDPRSYTAKSVGARMLVISAGVIMNLILAVILFIIVFMVGIDVSAPIIGSVSPDSAAMYVMPTNAEEAGISEPGIHPGDRVLTVNGDPARRFEDILVAGAIALAGKPVDLEVIRGDQRLNFEINPQQNRQTKMLGLGFDFSASNRMRGGEREDNAAIVQSVLERDGLAELGVEPGMYIVAVNDEPVDAYWKVTQALNDSAGEPLKFTLRDESNTTVDVTLEPIPRFMPGRIRDRASDAVFPAEHIFGLAAPIKVIDVNASRAEKAGLQVGDIFARAGSFDWPRSDQLRAAAYAARRKNLDVTVLRDGERVDLSLPVAADGMIGISQVPAMETTILADTLNRSDLPGERDEDGVTSDEPGPPYAAAGLNLLPGTRVVAIDGTPVESWTEILRHLRMHIQPGTTSAIEMEIELPTPGSPRETVSLVVTDDEASELARAGWSIPLGSWLFEPLTTELKADDPISALTLGFNETKRVLYQTYLTLDRLFRGTIKVEHLKGPVGIADIGTKVASAGFMHLIMFVAIISVNLAVLNFLPIPIVDGGLFVFLIVEKIKGSPVSERTQGAATLVGIAILGSVFLITFYNDVATLIRGWLG